MCIYDKSFFFGQNIYQFLEWYICVGKTGSEIIPVEDRTAYELSTYIWNTYAATSNYYNIAKNLYSYIYTTVIMF